MKPEDLTKLDKNVAVLTSEFTNLEEKVDDGFEAINKTMDDRFASLNKKLEDLITRPEFTPVKMIAYGLATAVLSSVMMAIMAKVLIK